MLAARPIALTCLAASANAYSLGATARMRTVPTGPVMSGATAEAVADDEFAGVKPGTVFMFPGQGAQVVGMGLSLIHI